MSRKLLLWLVPIFLTIHNLEEASTMQPFLEKRNAAMSGVMPAITYKQFLIALALITIIPYLITLFWLERPWATYTLVGFQVVMLINVVVHSLMALYQRGYVPGLITALLINLPFSLYLLKRAYSERWVGKKFLGLMFPLGLLIHGPVLAGLMLLAGLISNGF